jgi:hypothetical protein
MRTRTHKTCWHPRTESTAELNPNRPFNFISDPGHGYLKVARRFLEQLGIATEITSYSFQTPHTGYFVYLEEDSDAACFADAFKAKYGHDPIMRVLRINEKSIVRTFPRYMDGRRFHAENGRPLLDHELPAESRSMVAL